MSAHGPDFPGTAQHKRAVYTYAALISALDDLLGEAEQLQRSALDRQAAQLPEAAPRDRLDAPTLNEAVAALCSFLQAARLAKPKHWREEPERQRVMRRERTRLLHAQDRVAQRVQQ